MKKLNHQIHAETRQRIKNLVRPGRISKTYSSRLVAYGNTIEVVSYRRPQITFRKTNEVNMRRSSGSRSKDSVRRATTAFYRLCEHNADLYDGYKPTFVTLTYKRNALFLSQTNNDFKKFIKKLHYATKTQLQYIAVPEFQKRGAVHYHVLFFNLPFFEKERLESTWGHGYTQIVLVKKIKNMSAYFTKYFMKAVKDKRLFNKKSYLTSKGIVRPVKIYGQFECQNFIMRATIKESSSTEDKHKKITKIICKKHTSLLSS